MQTAIDLTLAIQILNAAQVKVMNVAAINDKLYRAKKYLNDQLALELSA